MSVRIGVIAASLLLATASTGSAQRMVSGLAAGATYSDFENPDTESRWGFSGGLFVGVSTGRSVSLLEVSYTQKGDANTRIDYIETGITGGAVAGRPDGARGRFYGGITVAFPVSCEGDNLAADTFCGNTKTEWGAPLGMNLGRVTPSGTFVGLDIRYTFPLSDAGLEIYNNPWMFRLTLGKEKRPRR